MEYEMGFTSLNMCGRVVTPKKPREKLGSKSDQSMIVEVRRKKIVLRPPLLV